jgi:PAS domain-containing protein
LQEIENREEVLELKAVYAYDRKRFIDKQIRRGQGLIGQIWLEKEPVYMPQVPANYSEIVSGLGGAAPRAVLLMPMINNEGVVLGVLEIASLQPFVEYEINFVRSVGEMIVSAIASIKGNERTQTLLDEARRISDKVRAQEETMRYEVQQLQASRHQLNIQNFQLQTRFQDFDKSLSIMELDPKGSVIRANEFMLDALGYEEEAVFNENFAKFVSERAFQSTAFQHLWQNVLEGIGQNQQMTFYTFNNTPLSFWVHFVPLRNEKDVVNHIVAICTDITSVQTSLERAQSRWSAIRQIFYYVEFTPFGIIQEANQPYLKLVGRTLGQIRNLPHSVLLPPNSTQSPHNQEFWHELSQGKAQIANYYHLTAKGDHLLLFGVYYPVFNTQRVIESVVFLAQPIPENITV